MDGVVPVLGDLRAGANADPAAAQGRSSGISGVAGERVAVAAPAPRAAPGARAGAGGRRLARRRRSIGRRRRRPRSPVRPTRGRPARAARCAKNSTPRTRSRASASTSPGVRPPPTTSTTSGAGSPRRACSALSCRATSCCAYVSSSAPAAVSVTWRVVRVNSGLPTRSSSRLISRLSACWATNRRPAARLKCSSSATTRNDRSIRISSSRGTKPFYLDSRSSCVDHGATGVGSCGPVRPSIVVMERTTGTTVAGLYATTGALTALWGATLPTTEARLDLGPGRLGAVLLAAGAAALIAMPAAGRGVDRWGAGRLLRCAAPGVAVATVAAILAPGFAALTVAAVALGFLMGALNVALTVAAAAVEAERARPIMSRVHGMWSLGAGCGAATVALGLHLGVAAPVLVVVQAGGSAVCFALLARGLAVDRPRRPAVDRWPGRRAPRRPARPARSRRRGRVPRRGRGDRLGRRPRGPRARGGPGSGLVRVRRLPGRHDRGPLRRGRRPRAARRGAHRAARRPDRLRGVRLRADRAGCSARPGSRRRCGAGC